MDGERRNCLEGALMGGVVGVDGLYPQGAFGEAFEFVFHEALEDVELGIGLAGYGFFVVAEQPVEHEFRIPWGLGAAKLPGDFGFHGVGPLDGACGIASQASCWGGCDGELFCAFTTEELGDFPKGFEARL